MIEPRPRKPRRDAVENRERILAHAEETFAVHGIDVSLHRLAEGMGVGIGTLYRHFPTLEDLHLALHERASRLAAERLVAVARIAGPWDRIVGYFDAVVDLLHENPVGRLVTARILRQRPDLAQPLPPLPELEEATGRARELGLIRPDVDTADVAVLPYLMEGLLEFRGERGEILRARTRGLLLDSLRPDGVPATPLPFASLPATSLVTLAGEHGRDAIGSGERQTD